LAECNTAGTEGAKFRLTRRELEVLHLVSEGKSDKEVADSLFIDPRTVGFHLSRAYKKMGVKNRVQAVRKASGLGLIAA
jgi:DNA-binding CsgD family transcriptional regulator